MGNTAQEILNSGGYPVLALLVLLENLFPPIPSEAVLPFAGFRVHQGAMVYPLAVLAATTGSVTGALILYGLSRAGGRPLLLRWGTVLRLDERRLDRADEWFDRHGAKIVFLGRMVPGVRSVVSIPAGLSEMPLVRFTVLTGAGSALWNSALIGAGWALGERWREVTAALEHAAPILLGAGVVLGLVLVAFYVVRRRRGGARA